jgi:integrase
MLYKRGDIWWTQFKSGGERVRHSCGAGDRKAALVEAARLKVEYARVAPRRGACQMSQLAAADIARARGDGVVDAWAQTLENVYWRNLLKHFGADRDPGTLTYDEVDGYVGVRRRKDRGQTVRREIQALKRGIEIAIRRQWLERPPCPFPKVRSDPPDRQQAGKWHDPEVLRRWLAEIDPKARDAITFALLTGVRSRELSRVRSDWIEELPEGVFLHIPAEAAKTGKERLVPLSADAHELLKRCKAFGTVCHRRTMVAAARRIGYDRDITLRDLRHVFATLAEKHDRKAAQDALGHTTERMTIRYLHSDPSRLHAIGDLVSKAIGATIGGPQSITESAENVGGRRGFRTHGIQLVRPKSERNSAESQETESHETHRDHSDRAGEGPQQVATAKARR